MNFQRLWENMNLGKEPEQPQEDMAMSAIRTGLNIREDFWEDFNSLVNNSEGLSKLLDIPAEKISTWRHKVNRMLDAVRQADGREDVNKNKKLIKTGMD